MVPPGQNVSAILPQAWRFPECGPVRLALVLACATGFLGAILHWSLQRPQDWSARWSMEDESTEDQVFHHARLAQGARLGPGRIGAGLHLPGKESLVVLDGWSPSEQWTVELWVRALNPTAETQLIAGRPRAEDSFGLWLSNGMFSVVYPDLQGRRAWLNSGIMPSTNGWYHLAASFNGKVVSIHVDGRLCARAMAGPRPPDDSASGIHLGADHLLVGNGLITTNCFTGVLDHLSVYPRALSAGEVLALYRSTAINPTARRWGRDIMVSLSFALLVTAGFGGLARLSHPKSAGVLDLHALDESYRAVIALLLTGLTLTGVLFLSSRREAMTRDQRRFHQLVTDFLDRFDTRTESYVQNLTALRSWLGGESGLTRERWQLMIESLQLWNDCPGLFSVGFAPIVHTSELTEFESWARGNIETNFQVHWIPSNPPRTALGVTGMSNLTVAFPITLHSHIYRPGDMARRRTEWGRDLLDPNCMPSSDAKPPISRTVLGAIKGQQATAGAAEELYSSGNTNASVRGTRVFLGVFATRTNISPLGQSSPSGTPARSRLGVLFGSFAWQPFFDSMLGAQKGEFRFTLFTPERDGMRFVLAKHGPRSTSEESSGDCLQTVYQSRFYGQRLHFDFQTLPAFSQRSERRWPFIIGGVGVALSLGVAGLVFTQARARLKEVAAGQELRRSHDQLRHLLQERERISRDLHDGIIQSIYGVGLGLKHSQKLIDRDPSMARTQLGDSIHELDGTISELRHFILRLEQDLPGGESLIKALESLVQRSRRVTHTRIEMHVDGDIEKAVSPYLSVHLMNLIREALSNAIRHASANRIVVSLQLDALHLRLQIADDGVGFSADAPPTSGSGLRNMRARTRELGGTFGVTSAKGSGTTILVMLPRSADSRAPSPSQSIV